MSYFDIKRDNEQIASGTHFWCKGCLVAKPLDDQSRGPRYCQSCYEVLSQEAKALPPKTGKPEWMPKTADKEVRVIPQDVTQNMATVNGKKNKVAIIPPPVAKVSHGKRGPKHKELPVGLITQWAGEGVGYKRIAAKLKAEHGIDIGFRTVARVVKGERPLL